MCALLKDQIKPKTKFNSYSKTKSPKIGGNRNLGKGSSTFLKILFAHLPMYWREFYFYVLFPFFIWERSHYGTSVLA